MKSRTRARSLALQVLYEYDISGHEPGNILSQRLLEDEYEYDEKLIEFANKIIVGVIPMTRKLDQFIAEHAPEWPMEQVAVIDRNIIRIALWEFAVDVSTPLKVAINEAIELSKMFGSDSTPRFVNGVLGSLAARLDEIKSSINLLQE